MRLNNELSVKKAHNMQLLNHLTIYISFRSVALLPLLS